jgi:hypothetical protein
MSSTTKSTTPAIDQAMLDKLLAVPAIQAALAESTAGEESTAAAARAAALEAKSESENALAEITSQRDGLDLAIAQLEDEINAMKRDRYTVSIAMQRASGRLRDLEHALREQHGGKLIAHVCNYLRNTAQNASLEAERQDTLKAPAGRNIMGQAVMKPDRKAAAKAVELNDAATGLRETADAIEALAVEPIAPQEIRRQIQAQLEKIGLTLYQGTLPEHMISRQVHSIGEGQERSVELLAPKIAA